jgi:hypothetical protein
MKLFIPYLAITFVLLLTIAGLISYCKRRQAKTRHGLTGMCHETGGTMCGSCSSHPQHDRPQIQVATCTRPSE